MIRRPCRVVPAVVVAVTLLAATILIIVSGIQALSGTAPVVGFADLPARGAELRWADPTTLLVSGIAMAIGVVLLVCAWTPGAPRVLPLMASWYRNTGGTTRRGLEAAVERTAQRTHGVTRARATVTARRVRAVVSTPLHDTADVAATVRAAVTDQLTGIGLRREPRVDVRVRRPGRR
jgi:hypothetical protein